METELNHLRNMADTIHEGLRPAAAALTPAEARAILLSLSKSLYHIHSCLRYLERRTREL